MNRLLVSLLVKHRAAYGSLAALTCVGSALLVSTSSLTLHAFRTGPEDLGQLTASDVSIAMAEVEGARVFNTTMLIIIGIAVSVLVASAATFALQGRRRELATLRLLGATRGQVVAITMSEISAVGLAASVVGGAAGMLVAPWHLAVESAIDLLPADLPLSATWSALALGVSVALVSAVVGGLVPATAISRADPLETFGEREVARRRSAPRAIVSLALAATAVWVQLWGASPDGEPSGPSLAIVVLWLSALLIVAPSAIQGVSRVLARIAHRRGHPAAMIASATVGSVPRRAASVSTPVVVVLSLLLPLGMIMAAGRAASESAKLAPITMQTVVHDDTGSLDENLYRVVDEHLGSAQCIFRYETHTEYVFDDDPFAVDSPDIRAVTPGCLLKAVDTKVLAGSLSDVTGPRVATASDAAVGDEIVLRTPSGSRITVEVAAVLEPSPFLADQILVDVATSPLTSSPRAQLWFVDTEPHDLEHLIGPSDRQSAEVETVREWVAHQMGKAGQNQRAALAMIFAVPLLLALAATVTATRGLVDDSWETYRRGRMLGLMPDQVRRIVAYQLSLVLTLSVLQVAITTVAVWTFLNRAPVLTEFGITPELPVGLGIACAVVVVVAQQLAGLRAGSSPQTGG